MLDNGKLINCEEKLVKHIAELLNGIFVHLVIFFSSTLILIDIL